MGFISPVATNSNGDAITSSTQSLGKDEFLQLLVAKLQYQDPLNPMEDEDFIAQLAQFSSLEQMNNIASGISNSNELDYLMMQSLNNVMASGLIGKDAEATYSSIYFDGVSSANINYMLTETAKEVTFTITDINGNVVNTITQKNLTEGNQSFEWDGTDSLGNRVDEGEYYIKAKAIDASGDEFTPSLSLVGTVESVIYRDGAAFVSINGTEIPIGDVSAVGEAGLFTSTNGESESDGNDGE